MSTKLFLGGVSPSTNGDVIRAHFSQYGAISDAVVMRDRGFGFVTFESSEAAQAALQDSQQIIDGQQVDVKPAVGKGGGPSSNGAPPGPSGITDKIFVGGLPQDCSDEKIREYFQVYGNIVDAVVMKDRDTGRSRGFGFIQFDNHESVEKVMDEYSAHKIDGKWVECKRSIPRDKMPPPTTSSYGKGKASAAPAFTMASAAPAFTMGGSGAYASSAYGAPAPAYGAGYGYGFGGYGSYGGYGAAYGAYPAYGGYAAPAYGGYGGAYASYGKGPSRSSPY